VIFGFIAAEKATHSIKTMCRVCPMKCVWSW
jgi:hypothetical protein